ncbi:trypsin-like peptidase domain-containing protein [Rubinisphaera italica]|uniref:Periplasmic serine endoprotease DegP n=1 Tax=Rubinisphaera italica TaxID=2527969 RepID=A0A5C5XCH9_9PLAN|nr:trypsin-like peptidase domain-containing protein [Rubinisphaera italica]TWT60151.1 Periplasmic serine endoprotease DegP precursor [Rubinisphaera italica]
MCVRKLFTFVLFLITHGLTPVVAWSEIPEDSPRRTETVKLIQQIEPAVVAIFSQSSEGGSSGSGSIIHPHGYVLTCDHVVRDRPGVVLVGGKQIRRYRIVARLPEKDLSIIQYARQENAPFISIGQSLDIMTGEPILVGGNPGGRGIVFTSGIVSSRSVVANMPNALAQAQLGGEYRDKFIQFDAASNRGNSGGPLFNALGEQIGVVSGKNFDEENINYAVPVETLRSHLKAMIAAEIRSDIYTGIECDYSHEAADVISVAPESPAGKAGLLPGDVITSLNEFPVDDSLHWLLSLMYRSPGEIIELTYLRDKAMHSMKFKLDSYPLIEPVEIDQELLEHGGTVKIYEGQFEVLPELEKMKPVRTVLFEDWKSPEEIAGLEHYFAMRIEGYLSVQDSDAIQFILGSDDGSRLRIDGQNVIDNPGHHPYQQESNWVRLEKGLHKIRIDYFESTGDSSLKLQWKVAGKDPEIVPAKLIFRKKMVEQDLNKDSGNKSE